METEINKKYLKVVNKIKNDVYHFYQISNQKDLIFIYEMPKGQILSYIYKEYWESLNPKSQELLKIQYKEANENGQLVLFIRDEEARVFKSYTI
jgi:hypothetical protein